MKKLTMILEEEFPPDDAHPDGIVIATKEVVTYVTDDELPECATHHLTRMVAAVNHQRDEQGITP